MESFELRIPQMGEGLQEARVLRFLKEPGDPVARDEAVYEIETDKAALEIPSPVDGRLERWAAAEDDVLPIGALVGRVATELVPAAAPRAASAEPAGPDAPLAASAPAAATLTDGPRNAVASPRARAYARDHGVAPETLLEIAARTGRKVTPEDVRRHMAARAAMEGAGADDGLEAYADEPLPSRQRTLVYRLERSARGVVPATIEEPLDWSAVDAARALYKAHARRTGTGAPTPLLLVAWCAARAARAQPALYCAYTREDTLRRYRRLHLGIAVARPGDELVLARVPAADTLEVDAFHQAAEAAVRRARAGEDQASEAMQISVSSLSGSAVRRGIPVIAAPAVGTLFIGAPFEEPQRAPDGGVAWRRVALAAFTFDHRVLNGAGAARYLEELRRLVAALPDTLASLPG